MLGDGTGRKSQIHKIESGYLPVVKFRGIFPSAKSSLARHEGYGADLTYRAVSVMDNRFLVFLYCNVGDDGAPRSPRLRVDSIKDCRTGDGALWSLTFNRDPWHFNEREYGNVNTIEDLFYMIGENSGEGPAVPLLPQYLRAIYD